MAGRFLKSLFLLVALAVVAVVAVVAVAPLLGAARRVLAVLVDPNGDSFVGAAAELPED